jgi:hypothetical protein
MIIATNVLNDSPSHMSQLFELCKAETKVWRELPNGGHNDSVAEPNYFDYIRTFVVDYVID